MAKALVLEGKGKLAIRTIDLPHTVGPHDVKIKIHTVGICGSDVHYFKHGKIGPFIVREPMVLGHEASGTVVEKGSQVKNLEIGDRVCMEPGIPDPLAKATQLGIYNVDPSIIFWATPPVHGCLTETVIHPAAFTFKLPDNFSYEQGAFVEPFATGMYACVKAGIKPGDVCMVTGCGPIGLLTAIAALASGASRVFITDIAEPKLNIARQYKHIIPVNINKESVHAKVQQECGEGWRVDVAFEASGQPSAYDTILECLKPAGTMVLIGMPIDNVPFDVVAAQTKEIHIKTLFRYTHIFDRAINTIAAGKVDFTPLLSAKYPFDQSIEAFKRAASARPTDVKILIEMPQ